MHGCSPRGPEARNLHASSVSEVTTISVPLLADSVRLRGEAEGGVDILDRRVYPQQIRWVHCPTVADVATAIRDMVTQSSGPVFAASAGLVVAARAARDLPAGEAADSLHEAGDLLAATRPTNNHVRDVVASVLAVLEQPAAAAGGDALVAAVTASAAGIDVRYRESAAALGRHTATLIPDGRGSSRIAGPTSSSSAR